MSELEEWKGKRRKSRAQYRPLTTRAAVMRISLPTFQTRDNCQENRAFVPSICCDPRLPLEGAGVRSIVLVVDVEDQRLDAAKL